MDVEERTGWDSNPRYPYGYTGFRDRLLQPLGHLSWFGPKDKGSAPISERQECKVKSEK
jgi:hypothetical protein